jgi:hypothetical protein
MTYFKNSRRDFLKLITTTALLPTLPGIASTGSNKSATGAESLGNTGYQTPDAKNPNGGWYDGPPSPLFSPIPIKGNKALSKLTKSLVSDRMDQPINKNGLFS